MPIQKVANDTPYDDTVTALGKNVQAALDNLFLGPKSLEAEATANTTTTSTSFGLVNSMTLTPPAGTWIAMFSSSVINSLVAQTTIVTLYVGGVQAASTERSNKNAGNDPSGVAFQKRITVNGSQAVEVRWKVTGGTGTIRQRTLTLFRVST